MPLLERSASHAKRLLSAAVLFLGYVVATEASYAFYAAPAIFPIQSGVALAGLVLLGTSFWPAVFLAAIAGYALNGAVFDLAFILAVGNTLQAVIAAFILKKLRFDPRLERMRDVFSLMTVALVASAAVPLVGFLGYAVREAFGGGGGIPATFGAWWAGHIMSLLVIAPFLIRWIAQRPLRRTRRQRAEIGLAFASLFAVNYILFFADAGHVRGVSLVYLLLVPLFWIALRFGMSLTTLAILGTGVMALAGISAGTPPPAGMTLGRQLFSMEIFIEVLAVIFFILAAVSAEKRRINEELTEHVGKLEAALQKIRSEDEAKNEFIAILAHELRNPLAPLASSIELLAMDGPSAADFPETLGVMKNQVATMARLLDDLLDISRISRQKLRLRKAAVDIAAVMQKAVQSTAGVMRARNHTLTVRLPEERLVVEADAMRLEQILVNLLNNAAKYTDPGGKIEMGARREEGTCIITVKDNGIGIAEDMLARIFEPFLQAHAAHGSGGIGIGLSLTKRLVELHGGSIDVDSKGEGFGSELTVRLPLLPDGDEGTASLEAPQEALRVQPQPARILIVDDNEAAAEALQKLLASRGHRTDTAFSGRAALSLAPDLRPDLVLLDIGLPDVSGYEVARRLRKSGIGTALVALSGFGQERDRAEAFAAGFDDHLTKPVGLAEIEAVLRRVGEKTEDDN